VCPLHHPRGGGRFFGPTVRGKEIFLFVGGELGSISGEGTDFFCLENWQQLWQVPESGGVRGGWLKRAFWSGRGFCLVCVYSFSGGLGEETGSVSWESVVKDSSGAVGSRGSLFEA
jgi:hypothetical protein